MDNKDEKLMNEKFEGVYRSFEDNFSNIVGKLDEVIKHQKITNGRVTALETNHIIDVSERRRMTDTLNKVVTTLDSLADKIAVLDKDRAVNELNHVSIKEDLKTITETVKEADKRGMGFWLWFSESKIRLVALFFPVVLVLFPSSRDWIIDMVGKLFLKMF